MKAKSIRSGIPALDQILQNIRLGDNVVWQISHLEDYCQVARVFIRQSIQDGYPCVYMRFAPHPPVLEPRAGLEIVEVDPSPGFDYFSEQVHRIIEARGRQYFYVFDNLSSLVAEWATDELLANFFQLTCPFLFELDTVAYFALKLGDHDDSAVARIRDTTQLLINLYRAGDTKYFHALKVWDRYSSQMFLPHALDGEAFLPLFQSGDAARAVSLSQKSPLRAGAESIAPWEAVYRKLTQFYEDDAVPLSARPEIMSLKQELARMILGTHPEFLDLAETYFTQEDLFAIRNRIIGTGRIGGKAAGMLLARSILKREMGESEYTRIMEEHDSFYIGSDVFFTFLVRNNLFRLKMQLSRGAQISREEYEEVENRFLEGHFPHDILDQFQNMLEYFGQAPIIVRSSSMLEDSFGNAFAGKYRSEFCCNQGSPEERLQAFLRAVKLVYASALNLDALSYRRKRGLSDRDEQMALLVQRVSGMQYQRYFFPPLAGVAFSHNLYAWTNRIDPSRGMIRLVFGLGTRAVDRTGGDYPRLIAISHPELRPETGAKVVKYSQREVDLLDLDRNDLVTLHAADILAGRDYPNQHLYVSLMKDGCLIDPSSPFLDGEAEECVLTFNNLIRQTGLVKIIGRMLEILARAYGRPIDTEFTAFIHPGGRVSVNLLQCRPMTLPGLASLQVSLPSNIPRERVLFRSSRIVNGGVVSHIQYVIYIDPQRYHDAPVPVKKSLGRIIGLINAHPRIQQGKVLMMGPGRWGSSNIEQGVNVHYADINNTSILVEIAREESGHLPEVSYGSHFFLDLVEDEIIYLPLFPNDPRAEFNEAYFQQTPNQLAGLVPEAAEYDGLIKIIDAHQDGRMIQVFADPKTQQAVCFLE
ncbi:MAG TPA: PEP/pyruvate-binding domain-containing protein [bacterium]|nr:phosphoenolpyruvate synthase [Candidatus Omnitrophota bacterium]HOL95100.1 PEP/pyruvate-binding domain-containing protein [bacterium]HPP00410.1 PEP/pyruvate-binding domain-containing protein [bacterium]